MTKVEPQLRIWRKGDPPHMGWWNASMYRDKNTWRWWSGERWSHGVPVSASCETAGYFATRLLWSATNEVEWSDFWPENARVPRIDPEDVKCK